MKKQASKVLVTERALAQRINRVLAKNSQALRKGRPDSPTALQCGTYFTVSTRTHGVVDTRIDIEAMGRKLEVLKSYEALAAE